MGKLVIIVLREKGRQGELDSGACFSMQFAPAIEENMG
jgi:hypothetical protein